MIYATGFARGGIAAGFASESCGDSGSQCACAIYATQPFPAKFLVLVSVGGFIEMIVTGLIVGAIYKPAVAKAA